MRKGYLLRMALFALFAAGVARPGLCQEEEGVPPKYTAEALRNPFKPYVVKAPPASVIPETEIVYKPLPSFDVQGVFWGGSFPQAILNGKIVKEGDIIEEAKIIGISKDKIRFMFANREFFITPPSAVASASSPGIRKEAP
ncbi:MAG: hypothetical protein ACM3OC_03185 [Deltaproteobacteria bacterium]